MRTVGLQPPGPGQHLRDGGDEEHLFHNALSAHGGDTFRSALRQNGPRAQDPLRSLFRRLNLAAERTSSRALWDVFIGDEQESQPSSDMVARK